MAKYNNSPIVRANLAAILAIARSDLPDAGSGIYPFMTAENTGINYVFDPDSTTIGFLPTGSSSAGRWIPINREVLNANRTYFVRTDGNDNNTGLANTAGGAFLTIQKAIDTVASLDIGIFDVTIQVANGTYNQSLTLKSVVGSGTIFLTGNIASPSNVTITSSTNPTISSSAKNNLYVIKGFTIDCTDTVFKNSIAVTGGLIEIGNLIFPSSGYCLGVSNFGVLRASSTSYTISGNQNIHIIVDGAGTLDFSNVAITLTGSPFFNEAFIFTQLSGASVRVFNSSVIGAGSGSRYLVRLNSTLYFNNVTFSSLSAGSTTSGGEVLIFP